MEKIEKFKKSIIRGAKIYDFYETLKHRPGLERDVTDILMIRLDESFKPEELNEEEKKVEIVSYYAKKIAYKRITDYMKREFEIKKYEKKEFKLKTFRGSKVFDIIRFLEFEIAQCENSIELYNAPSLSFDEFTLINYQSQLKIFYQVINLAIDGFINEKIKRDDFIGIWISQNMKLEEE